MDENLVYWHGVAVGIEAGGCITFFASATPEAINAVRRAAP
jgi:hypothetical protein